MRPMGDLASSPGSGPRRLARLHSHLRQREHARALCPAAAITTAAQPAPLGDRLAAMTPAALGGKLGRLADSSCLVGGGMAGPPDYAALQAQLQEDGYLFLRGFHPRRAVLDGRRELLEVNLMQSHRLLHLSSCALALRSPLIKPLLISTCGVQHLAEADATRDPAAAPLLQPGAQLADARWGGGRPGGVGHAQWPGPGGDRRGVRPCFLQIVNSPALLRLCSGLLVRRCH